MDTILCRSAAVLASLFLLFSCKEPSPATGNGNNDNQITDIEVIDGQVKFYVSTDDSSPRSVMGVTSRLTKVVINGKQYSTAKDETGKLAVTVDASSKGEYNAAYVNTLSAQWYGSSPNVNVKLPYSQFKSATASALSDFPMYASYSPETGNKLIFKDGFALLDIALRGDASITSVNVKNIAGTAMAGIVAFKPSTGAFTPTDGVAFAELNCTEGGNNVALSQAVLTHFYVMLAPGKYRQGLRVTVCDASHRMMTFDTEALEFDGNEVKTIEKNYAPDSDLLWYEGFDTFVWGGDYVGGESVKAYAPVEGTVSAESSSDLSGTEDAFVETVYDNPGTGYIQSNTWDDCSNSATNRRTVGTSHRMSDSYVKSRSIGDIINLFRCQERPGYIEVGGASTTRGIFRSARALNTEGIVDALFSFDVCLKSEFNDNIEVQIYEGGSITACSLNGKSLDLDAAKYSHYYRGNVSHLIIPASELTLVSKASDAKSWDHVEISLTGVTSGTDLYISTASSSSGHHGFFLDNVMLRKTSVYEGGSIRVLSWNIQNGMWADQGNNYDSFVKFVKKYDPDICIWCEASSIYKDGSTVSAPTTDRFLPDGWASLAARYGHSYTAIGGFRDNYPQVVTSKYPITTIKKITDTDVSGKPVSHGAGLHSITVSGREFYIVTLHTWPQSYAYGVATADREASTAQNGGDYYRQYEMQYVVNNTRNAAEYSSQKDWIFAGDFNSRSRKDNAIYGYDESSTLLLTQDVILNQTDYVDVISESYGDDFVATTQSTSRIDYVYMSPSLAADVKSARVLMDDWTVAYKVGTTGFYFPSDHRPILVDLK